MAIWPGFVQRLLQPTRPSEAFCQGSRRRWRIYLNNRLEQQDHRGIKGRIRCMRGLFAAVVQVDGRPVTDVAAQCRAYRARVRIVPVNRSGTKPATDRAERKNLRAAFMSRVALSIVSRLMQVAPAAMDLEVRFVSVTRSAQSGVQCRVGSCAAPRLSQAAALPPTAGWIRG